MRLSVESMIHVARCDGDKNTRFSLSVSSEGTNDAYYCAFSLSRRLSTKFMTISQNL